MSSNSPSSPIPPNNHLFLWILLLAAFGAPPAAYFSFTSYISQHLSIGIPILVSYESAIVIIAVLRAIWQDFQLTRAFVNILRSWTVYPRYSKYYRNHLIEIFNDDIVLGLDGPNAAKIEQIFVEPIFLENPSYQDLSNPHLLTPVSQSNKNTIWYYLSQEKSPKSLLILGAAGIGKSTLFKYLALTLSDRKKSTKTTVFYRLAFFLSLSKLSEEMSGNDTLSLEDVVESTIKERWNAPPAGWVEHQLKKDCLILLDGLDEVADANARLNVIKRIDQYTDQFSKNCFVISSRPLVQKGTPLKKMSTLGILPFNREQIFEFIDKWYTAIKVNYDDLKAKELKDRLSEPKSKHKFLDLARSPLLLGLIINVHQRGGRLPENRIELYERILEHYLGVRWRQISVAKPEPITQELLSMEEKRKLLQTLAYKMMENGKREIWPDEAKKILESCLSTMKVSLAPEHFLNSAADTGIWILGQLQGRSYKFAHLSFQAYLAAAYARSNPELLISHIHDNWWQETIILYCSQADPTAIIPIIKVCLREGDNRLAEKAENLALALYEEQEVQNILKSIRSVDIYERFNQAVMLAAGDQDIELRHRIANKLLNQRIGSLIDDEEWPIEEGKPDTSYIKCAEYQLFLDLTQSDRQPDHWKDTQFPKLQGYEPVLGIRLSDAVAFCDWLASKSPQSKTWYFRLPTAEESKNVSVGEKDQGFWSQDGNKFQFFGGNGKSSALNNINSDKLKSSLVKCSDLNQKDKELFDSTALDLANKISYINQIFNKSFRIYVDLIDSLSSINDRITSHQSELKANYNEANKSVDFIEGQISNAVEKRAEFQKELERIENLRSRRDKNKKRKIEAKKELDDIVVKQNNLLKEINKLLESIVSLQNKQKKPTQSQRPSSNNIAQQNQLREQRIAELVKKKVDKELQIQELEAEANKLKQEIQKKEIRESELANSLKDADQIEKNASQRLKEVLARETELAKQLEKARNDLAQAKQSQNAFEVFVREFDDFYKGFSFFKSHFESAYNNALSKSLTGYLNCDPELDLSVLLKKDYYTIENALAESCTSLSKYINELTNKLVNHLRKADNSIIKSEDIVRAENLANRLNKLISLSKEHIIRLANILDRDCLANLNKKRSLIRESSLRRIICYASGILVKYQSYWLPKEFSSEAYQYAPWRDIDLNLTGRYSDIFIAFALLEERINGTLPASAGILIVRDIRRGNQQVI